MVARFTEWRTAKVAARLAAHNLCVVRFLTTLPAWLCFLTIYAAVGIFTALGLRAARWIFERFEFPHNQGLTGPLISATASTQAFFLGFVIVNLWVGFRTVETNVLQEGIEVVAVHHDLEAYPSTLRAPLDMLLHSYVVEVVDKEWPELAKGTSSARAANLLETLDARIHRPNLPAIDPAQRADLVRRIGTLEDLRSSRLRAREEQIQPVIWIALLGLGALLLITTYFMDSDHAGLQYTATLVFATTLAFGLFIAVQLDYPFVGDTSVRATPLADAAKVLETR